ncbi:penicillin-binding protein [Sesbania bispinosa]|nr:penicillin-binding protein [Sesbania bispinosa]
MGVFVVPSKNNPSGNSSSFRCLFCDEIEEGAAKTAVFDAGAEIEQRVTRKSGLGLSGSRWIWYGEWEKEEWKKKMRVILKPWK